MERHHGVEIYCGSRELSSEQENIFLLFCPEHRHFATLNAFHSTHCHCLGSGPLILLQDAPMAPWLAASFTPRPSPFNPSPAPATPGLTPQSLCSDHRQLLTIISGSCLKTSARLPASQSPALHSSGGRGLHAGCRQSISAGPRAQPLGSSGAHASRHSTFPPETSTRA